MQAPDFSLSDQNGTVHSLKDYAGEWLVLYFYPKDETSGCTKEACNFRDARGALAEMGQAEVVGMNQNSVASHKAFSENHRLNFTLLSDLDHETLKAYGAWHGVLGTHRNTVIIDPKGNIAKKYKGVSPETHVGEILADLKQLQGRA